MEELLNSFQHDWDPAAMLRLNNISRKTQLHLRNTYATLSLGVAVSVLGVIAHLHTGLGGILTGFGALGCLMALSGSRRGGYEPSSRLCLFAGFTFFKGASLGHLVQHILHVDPGILITAFLATVAVFLCFSLAALNARRREFLFLGGFLGSAVSLMALGSLANVFFRSQALLSFELYAGLAVFCGYIIFDTQLIIERSEAQGDNDYIWSGTELYIDLVAIFVRLAVILMQQQQKKNKHSKDRRDRRDRR